MASHSLSLMAESGHMVADGAALGLALLAAWMGRSPSTDAAPFGYRRVEILAALVNGLGLLAVAGWIGWEAIAHLTHGSSEILSGPMLITALVGLGVNSVNASLLHNHSHYDLNVRGAFLHMVADMISALGVLLAAIAIFLWHWLWVDSAVSLGVALLIGSSAVPFIRQSLAILLALTPRSIELASIRTQLLSTPGVLHIDTLNVWAIAPDYLMLTARIQVNVPDGGDRDRLLRQLTHLLQSRWGIHEPVLQLEGRSPHYALELMPELMADLPQNPSHPTLSSDGRSLLNLSSPADLTSLLSSESDPHIKTSEQ